MEGPRRTFLKWLGALGLYALWPARSSRAAPATPRRVIYLNPGHGGADQGAVHKDAVGKVDLTEAEANLGIALKLAALLREKGYTVILSREGDEDAPDEPRDINGDGRLNYRDGLQRVIDEANEQKADLLISIHNNGAPTRDARGTEIYYCASRPFADQNRRLARLALTHILEELKKAGYEPLNRGIKDDRVLYRGRGHLFLLGPAGTSTWRRQVHPRETKMPGILGETLFVTNDVEAALLKRDDIRAAIARGYAAAVDAFFATA